MLQVTGESYASFLCCKEDGTYQTDNCTATEFLEFKTSHLLPSTFSNAKTFCDTMKMAEGLISIAAAYLCRASKATGTGLTADGSKQIE